MSVIGRDRHDPEAIDALANHLLMINTEDGSANQRWDVIELEGVVKDDPNIVRFTEFLSNAGCPVDRQLGPSCWKVSLPESWDTFVQAHSKNRRKRLRRLDKQYFQSGRATLQIAGDDREFANAMSSFERLHQKRRISLGEAGRFSSSQFANFIKDVSQQFWLSGKLELACLTIDGQVAAIEYNLLSSDTVYSYQGGLDPDFLDASAGHLLTMSSIRHSISQGRRCYDLLRGDESYKLHWGPEPLPTETIRISANGGMAQIRHNAWLAARHLKQVASRELSFFGTRSGVGAEA
jgi:CelD/BcsL family acetyltransferase involved in cellulose biosynthesis